MAKKKNPNSVLVGAGLFIGLGVGLLIEQVAAGIIIGLGVGLMAMFFASKKCKK